MPDELEDFVIALKEVVDRYMLMEEINNKTEVNGK